MVVWEYLPKCWTGKVAAEMYAKFIKKALKKHRPGKLRHKVMEDNDPTGYKSSKARKAKKDAKIDVVSLPKYSMDLNPWDFCLFEDIEGRAAASAPKGKETLGAFKKRLRLVALRTPAETIRKAFANIKPRCKAIVKAKGRDIDMD